MKANTTADSDRSSRLATVAEAANYLNVSRSMLYTLMEAGTLAYVKLGKCRRVPWENLERLVSQSTVGV